MGKTRERNMTRSSQTLPSSPSHSSSSSDFEFSVSISPRTNSFNAALCPADDLFYKGQLLPLQLSPRLSMVRNLLLASSSSSSACDSSTTASRDSTASSSSVDHYSAADSSSGRPSSVADDEYRALNAGRGDSSHSKKYFNKYFSLSRFSSVFKKETKANKKCAADASSAPARRSSSAREVVRKYLKKVKPLYEKIAHQQGRNGSVKKAQCSYDTVLNDKSMLRVGDRGGYFSMSFSGNLSYPTARMGAHVSSCPSSMRSSPCHSGLLCRKSTDSAGGRTSGGGSNTYLCGDTLSSMEEVQSAIQGAIAHCKNSLLQKQEEVNP